MKITRFILEFEDMDDYAEAGTVDEIEDRLKPDDYVVDVIWQLEGGERLYNVHPGEQCVGRPCTVHNPSNHHMRHMPQHWRSDRGIMERICEHGIGHPDPDEIDPDTVHGCCGVCCRPPT
jgi:hypothetical protein